MSVRAYKLLRYWMDVLNYQDLERYFKTDALLFLSDTAGKVPACLKEGQIPSVPSQWFINNETHTEAIILVSNAFDGIRKTSVNALQVLSAITVQVDKCGHLQTTPYSTFALNQNNIEEYATHDGRLVIADESLQTKIETQYQDLNMDITWQAFWKNVSNTLSELFGEDGKIPASERFQDARYRMGFFLVKAQNNTAGALARINKFYRFLLHQSRLPGLLKPVLTFKTGNPALLNEDELLVMEREYGALMTQSGERVMPLDPWQRRAVLHYLALKENELLAVNGPPGTGKTAMIKSVVAAEWVRHTLAESDPDPLWVVASGATNKSVTNIIDAFGASEPGNTDTACVWKTRWIKGINRFGWYIQAPAGFKRALAQSKSEEVEQKHLSMPWQNLLYDWDEHTWKPAGSAWHLREAKQNVEERRQYAGACFKQIFPEYAGQYSLKKMAKHLHKVLSDTREQGIVLVLQACEELKILKEQESELSDNRLSVIRKALDERKEKYRQAEKKLSLMQSLLRDAEQNWQGMRAQLIMELKNSARVLNKQQKKEQRLFATLRRLNALQALSLAPTKNGTSGRWFKRTFLRTVLWWQGYRVVAGNIEILIQDVRQRNRRTHLSVIEVNKNAEILELLAKKTVKPFEPYTAGPIQKAANSLRLLQNYSSQEEYLRQQLFDEQAACNALTEQYRALQNIRRQQKKYFNRIRSQVIIAEHRADKSQVNMLNTLIRQYYGLNSEHWFQWQGNMNALIDQNARMKCFYLCGRYWELRWLLSLSEDSRKDSVDQLRTMAMLAPVMVTTLAFLPELFRTQGGYRTEEADLLIVDEAGQSAPESSVFALAMAKKALIVGDVDQLAPIRMINRQASERLQEKNNLAQIVDFEQSGSDPSTGSLMRIAQYYTRYSIPGQPHAGMMLSRHYRCHPDIIGYCQKLVYGDALVPVSDPKHQAGVLPAMGYIYTPGQAIRHNKSWVNRDEAEYLAQWLKHHEADITQHYQCRELSEVLGIIVPFRSQVAVIKQALEQQRINTDNMVIGTVNSLQGAEKKIIIFGFVVQPAVDSYFLDAHHYLLNVAVSRAQDSFILMSSVLPKKAKTSNPLPSELLLDYLYKKGMQVSPTHTVIVESPQKARKIRQWAGPDYLCLATGGHFRDIDRIDIDQGFRPDWRVNKNRISQLQMIREAMSVTAGVLIATDPDAEGELIGWHIRDHFKEEMNNKTVNRMRFYALTEHAVHEALSLALSGQEEFNGNQIKSALIRTIVDALIARHYQDAGRVQMALLTWLKSNSSANPAAYIKDVQLEWGGRRYPAREIPDPFNEYFTQRPDASGHKDTTTQNLSVLYARQSRELCSENRQAPADTLNVLTEAAGTLNLPPRVTMDYLQQMYLMEHQKKRKADGFGK